MEKVKFIIGTTVVCCLIVGAIALQLWFVVYDWKLFVGTWIGSALAATITVYSVRWILEYRESKSTNVNN